MALYVDYKKPYGYFTATTEVGGKKEKNKVTMCRANCMWAEIWFSTEMRDGKKVRLASLGGFFNDPTHLKRCSVDNLLKNYDNYVFYAERIKGNKYIWKAIQILAESGKKVTIK